jgi:hypothetical protein
VAGEKREGPERLAEPVSLLGLNLGEVLLGLTEVEQGQTRGAPDGAAATAAEDGPVLRLPGGRVEPEPLLGGFFRRDQAGGLTVPRIATRREGKRSRASCTGSRRAGRSTPACSRPQGHRRSRTRRRGRSSGTATRRCAR